MTYSAIRPYVGGMKRLLTILTITTAVLGTAAIADAAFKAGTYKGKTQWDKPMSFTASKTEVTGFKIRAQYGCTDFDQFYTTEKGFPAIKINDEGKFVLRFTNSDGSYTGKIKGTLTGKTAKGWYEAERTYNRNDELDPNGNITCIVHRTTWKAEKTS
jgi:hypothetical protein